MRLSSAAGMIGQDNFQRKDEHHPLFLGAFLEMSQRNDINFKSLV